MQDKVNLAHKLAAFSERWSPKIVGELNDYEIQGNTGAGGVP